MVRRLARNLVLNGVLMGSATALAIKLGAAIVGFAMFALSSRYMEPASFGSLAIIFNAISFLSVIALCGQETLIARSWDEYMGSGRPALARGAFTFGASVVIGAALVMALAVAIAWPTFDRAVSVALVGAASAYLFAHALMQFLGQFSRVAGGVLIGEPPRELMWRLIVVAAITVHHFLGLEFDATNFFLASAGALVTAILFQAWQVARVVPHAVKSAASERQVAVWVPRSFRMWLAALMDTTGQYLEVVVIGLFLGPAAAGFYFVATRITNVFAMIAGSISVYATPQISALFYKNAKHELQSILTSLALIGAILVGGAFLTVLLFGKLLLFAFGSAYVSAYPALIVLAAGASIGALAGPATHVLLLTGNEGSYPRLMGCTLLLRFGLIAILGPTYGLMGAVVAWCISAVFMTAALIIACRRLVGLDPSLLQAFGSLRQPVTPIERGTP
jgi:O-antigen/teichoic acid export membrane protein